MGKITPYLKTMSHTLHVLLLLVTHLYAKNKCFNPTVLANFKSILTSTCTGYKVSSKFVNGEVSVDEVTVMKKKYPWSKQKSKKKIGYEPKVNVTVLFPGIPVQVEGSTQLTLNATHTGLAVTRLKINDDKGRFVGLNMSNLVEELRFSKNDKIQNVLLDNKADLKWNDGEKSIGFKTLLQSEGCIGIPKTPADFKNYASAGCTAILEFQNRTLHRYAMYKFFYMVQTSLVDVGMAAGLSSTRLRIKDDKIGHYKISLIESYGNQYSERHLYTLNASSIDTLTENFADSVVQHYNHLSFMPTDTLHSVVQLPDSIKESDLFQNYGEQLFNVEKTPGKYSGKIYEIDVSVNDLMEVKTSEKLGVGLDIVSRIISGSNNITAGLDQVLNGFSNFAFNSKPPNTYFTITTTRGDLIYKSIIVKSSTSPRWNSCNFQVPAGTNELIFTIFHTEKEGTEQLGMLDIEKVVGLAKIELSSDDTMIYTKYRIESNYVNRYVELINSKDVATMNFEVVVTGTDTPMNLLYRLRYKDDKSTIFESKTFKKCQKAFWQAEKAIRYVKRPIEFILLKNSGYILREVSVPLLLNGQRQPILDLNLNPIGKIFQNKVKTKSTLLATRFAFPTTRAFYYKIHYGGTLLQQSPKVQASKLYYDPVKLDLPVYIKDLTITVYSMSLILADGVIMTTEIDLKCRWGISCKTEMDDGKNGKGIVQLYSDSNEILEHDKKFVADFSDFNISSQQLRLQINYGDRLLADTDYGQTAKTDITVNTSVNELEVHVIQKSLIYTYYGYRYIEQIYGAGMVKTAQLATKRSPTIDVIIRKIKNGQLDRKLGTLKLTIN